MATHKKPPSERFKGPSKWIQYVLARCLISFFQRLPIGFAYSMGRSAGWVCWKLMSKRRTVVESNLTIVNEWLTAQGNPVVEGLSIIEQTKEVFLRAGANLFSGFTFARMSVDKVREHVEVEGLEHLKSALSEEKGAVVLLAHMGPWEALAQLPELGKSSGIDVPFGTMYRPLNNNYLDDWYRSQRAASGTALFNRNDGFHRPVDFVRAGGMLGILADQKMRQGTKALYFGQKAKTSPLPGLFQRRSGAPALVVSIQTTAPTRWTLSIIPVDFSTIDEDRNRETEARLSNQAIEQALAKSPLDGFWLHGRF